MHKLLRAAGVLWRLGFQAEPRLFVGSLFLAGLENTRPLQALAVAFTTDAALRGEVTRAVVGGVIIGGFGAAFRFGNIQGHRLRRRTSELTGLRVDSEMMDLASAVPTLTHFEKPEYADRLALLTQRAETIAFAPSALLMGVGVLFNAVLTVSALAYLDPLLVLLPLFGLPSIWASARAAAVDHRADKETTELRRQARHLFHLATDVEAGPELRIFGLGAELGKRHRDTWRQIDVRLRRAGWRSGSLAAVGWMVFALGFMGAIAVMTARAAEGQATAGELLATIALAGGLTFQITSASFTVRATLDSLRAADDYLWLVDYSAAEQGEAPRERRMITTNRLTEGIRIEEVSFSYPGLDEVVLEDITLDLPAGKTVAIVGDNGAGKTTLVKLLCGFYAPTSGRISVDGVPMADLDLDAWRQHIAAGFQDFVRYELLARETVGVGDLPRAEDEDAVRAAIDRAGARDVIEALPRGLDTQLGRAWTDGTEMSGGQWQKLALSRAMMREVPLLLLLDEPTASLDAETEHHLFERYSRSAGALGSAAGTITVLVSHRFSTVLMADIIVVLENGRILEVGAHSELLRRGGMYAELFALQAAGYR